MCQIMAAVEKSIHCIRFRLSEANHSEETVNNSSCEADGHLSKLVVAIPTDMPLAYAEKNQF